MLVKQLCLAEAMALVILLALFVLVLPLYFLLTRKNSQRVPPGSLGFPVIGQTLSFIRAFRQNKLEQWLRERSRKYGPVSKMSIFGSTVVFLNGQAYNKFIYTTHDDLLSNKQPYSTRKLFGERNIMELTGEEYKLVKGALVSFLKPNVLKQYVGMMDVEVRSEMRSHLGEKKKKIQAMPFMKKITFYIIASLIMGIEKGPRRDKLTVLFNQIMDGVIAVPINLPFTTFGQSLKAREELNRIMLEVIGEKRAALEKQEAVPEQDLLSSLISLQNEDDSVKLSDNDIIESVLVSSLAGYDTTASLLSLMVRFLAIDASVRSKILHEHEEIARSKAPGELLTWDDLLKMKYTWIVALETLRLYPPVPFSVRKAVKDFEYEGFLIPKGWQLLVTPSMTHTDDNIFPNASKFDPARFEKQPSNPPYSYVPFGGGYRICPGNEYAKIETLVIFHNLVTRYTWKLSSPDIPVSRNPFPCFKDNLEIEIEPKISTKLN